MTAAQLVVAHAAKIALLAALVGTLVRGRYRRCYSFLAYLVAVLLGNALVSLWPDRFYTEPFWILKQAVYDILKLAIPIEVGVRLFSGHTRAGGERTALHVLAVTAILVAVGPGFQVSQRELWAYQPRVVAATAWLFGGLALMCSAYRVAIDPWVRAMLSGFAAYLLVFQSTMWIIQTSGWTGALPWTGSLEPLAYVVLACWWAVVTWRPVRSDAGSVVTLRPKAA